MAFALTKVLAKGVEYEQGITKRYLQHMYLTITAENTDTDLDIGDHVAGSLGTFWAAADGTATGLAGLTAIQDITKRAQAFISVMGDALDTRAKVDASRTAVLTYNATPQAPGGDTATYVVTGLLATDTVIGLTPIVGTAAIEKLTSTADDEAVVVYTADPGAGSTVRVAVTRAAGSTTPDAGSYQIVDGTLAPNISFASGDAPTTATYRLEWLLKNGEEPVEFEANA
jgi:hypothetical protein